MIVRLIELMIWFVKGWKIIEFLYKNTRLECYVMNDDEMKNWRIERMVELMICFEDYRRKYDK